MLLQKSIIVPHVEAKKFVFSKKSFLLAVTSFARGMNNMVAMQNQAKK